MKRITAILLVLLLAVSMLTLIACGDDDTTTTTTTTTSATTTTTPGTPSNPDPGATLPGADQFANDNEATYNPEWAK